MDEVTDLGMVARLAVWSGPRNISTAVMRAWENRPDTLVVDEPLYAHYLAVTGRDHPGRADIIGGGETDWRQVVGRLLGPVGDDVRVFYQKHMAHHLTPDIDTAWVSQLTNVLLIREPDEVVASYVKRRDDVTPDDIGLPQQVRLFDELCAADTAPLVIDSADFRRDPAAHLRKLCRLVHVEFTERMLTWPPGPRASDGEWAPYWYDGVWRSTGFEPYRPRQVELTGRPAEVAAECRGAYERLHAVRWLP